MSELDNSGWLDTQRLPFPTIEHQIEAQPPVQVNLNERLAQSGSTLRVVMPENNSEPYRSHDYLTIGLARYFPNGRDYTALDGGSEHYEQQPITIGLQTQISEHIFYDLGLEYNSVYDAQATSLTFCAETDTFLGLQGGSLGACVGGAHGYKDDVDPNLLINNSIVPTAKIYGTVRLSNSDDGMLPKGTDAVIGVETMPTPTGMDPMMSVGVRFPLDLK